jgi:hypothetical protein
MCEQSPTQSELQMKYGIDVVQIGAKWRASAREEWRMADTPAQAVDRLVAGLNRPAVRDAA